MSRKSRKVGHSVFSYISMYFANVHLSPLHIRSFTYSTCTFAKFNVLVRHRWYLLVSQFGDPVNYGCPSRAFIVVPKANVTVDVTRHVIQHDEAW